MRVELCESVEYLVEYLTDTIVAVSYRVIQNKQLVPHSRFLFENKSK